MSGLLHERARRGLMGTMLIVLVVLASLNLNRLPLVGNSEVIHARFAEAGGLRGGDSVVVSGAEIGKVREVTLEDGVVEADLALTDPDVELGDQTEARIITTTLLGRAAVELVPAGGGDLEAGETIPVERTDSPYSITSALNQLTTESGQIDKEALQRAIDQASSVLEGSQGSVGPALRGITDISRAIAANDDQLATLLDRATRVTGVLADRDQQVASLLTAGESLFAELDARQRVVEDLLSSAQALAAQLRAVLEENAQVIGPALRQLNDIVAVLNRNKKAIQDTLVGLRGYATAFGDAASTGPWFDAYIQNLTDPATLAPILSGILP
ncbi:MCE family protein [Nocardioides carbamazepini]|uniref:MCE family protein n=1 Tax=Nocardioides carbamazepini TaxID=2854259 RepID=UPI00214A209C|nr:MCE family protein [Nocardioides carbamazepini]MCR1781379.1 MCE family protein [Nocardioides carbamazepini]